MDDHVHVGHGPSVRCVILTVELERDGFVRLGPFLHGDLAAFHEKTTGTAARVVDLHSRLGLEHARHDGTDPGRGVELAGALAAALGELADKVFVALADDVGLDVFEPEALGADGLDEVGEEVIVEVALAVGSGVKVHAVNDSPQARVFLGDSLHVGSDAFADLVGERSDDRPDGLLRVFRDEREIEADELVVGPDELEGLLTRADLVGDAVQLVIKNVTEALDEDEGEDVVLVFRRVFDTPYKTGSTPEPRFERFRVSAFIFQLTYSAL